MTVARRTKFPVSTPIIGGLVLISGSALFIFTKWFVAEVKEPSDKISAMGLAFTILTTTCGAIIYLLQQNKQKADDSEKSAYQALQSRIVLIRKSRIAAEGALTDKELISLMPPQLQEHTQHYLNQSRFFENHLDICQSVADYLAADKQRLQLIAKAGADDTLSQLNPVRLKRLGLANEASRECFYTDIYKYLKVWLTLSIEYLQPMPTSRIHQSIDDRRIYIDTLAYIKDKRIQWFHLPDQEAEEIVKQYLETLISKLEKFQD